MTLKSESAESVDPLPRFRLRLVTLLMLAAILPLIVLSIIAGVLLYNASGRQAADRLYTTASYRQAQLDHWIDGLTSALIKLASNQPNLPDNLQHRDLDSAALLTAFRGMLGTEGLSELMLLSEDDRVQLSTNPDRITPPVRVCPPRIICAFEFAVEADHTRLIVQYPLTGGQGQQVGMIVGLADLATLDAILSNRAGLGVSGAAYLVSVEGSLRWLPGYGSIPQKQVALPPLERAILPSEPMTYSGVSGKNALGIATSILRLNAWLILEQPLDEVYQSLTPLPLLALAVIALSLAVIILGSRLLARQVATPLTALMGRAAQLDAALDNAQNAYRLKSRTIADMSHELRTPINSILNFSGFLMDNLFGDLTLDQAELVKQMHASSVHLLDLINDLLDMSKFEAGQMRLFLTEFDPAPVFDQAIATLRSLTLKKPVTVQVDLPQTWPTIRGDRRRILQILLNLVSNAAKFTDEGTITLRVHVYATRLEVRIEDSGMGVDPADVPNIFEPFRQGYNALLLEKGGTGLGLPLSRIFARMHGGDLDYQPGDHGGALFIFWAPLDAIAYEQKSVKLG